MILLLFCLFPWISNRRLVAILFSCICCFRGLVVCPDSTSTSPAEITTKLCHLPEYEMKLDLIDRYQQTSISVFTHNYRSLRLQAIQMCSLFTGSASILRDSDYCVSNKLASLRVIKTLAITRISKNTIVDHIHRSSGVGFISSSTPPPMVSDKAKLTHDALALSYSYAYDRMEDGDDNIIISSQDRRNDRDTNSGNNSKDVSSKANNPSTVCMFGELSMNAILMALSTTETVNIVIVNNNLTPDDMFHLSVVQQELSCNSSSTIAVWSMTELLLHQQSNSLFGRVCDTIHIFGGVYRDMLLIVKSIEPCSGSRAMVSDETYDEWNCKTYYDAIYSFNVMRPVRIIWEYYHSYHDTTFHHKHPYINPWYFSVDHVGVSWLAFQTSMTNSELAAIQSSEGSHSKKFGIYVNFEFNAVDTWMGELCYVNCVAPVQIISPIIGTPHKAMVESMVIDRQHVILVISFNGRVFAETALGFKKACIKAGYVHTAVLGDVTLFDIKNLNSQYQKKYGNREPLFLQLVFGVMEPSLLLPNYIVYETEHYDTLADGRSIAHRSTLRRAKRVLAFSPHQAQALYSLGMSIVSIVPLYSFVNPTAFRSADDFASADDYIDSSDSDNYDRDVLFFGGSSARRNEMFPIVLSSFNNRSLFVEIFDGTEANYLCEEQRDAVVSRSKVIINFHGCNGSSLAIHRIHYLLGMGKCVISERSEADPDLDANYSESVVFVDRLDQMGAVAEYYVRNPRARKFIERNARRQFEAMHNDVTSLREALDSTVVDIANNVK